MDFRVGLGRESGAPALRLLTQNLGASHVTSESLDRFLRVQRIDVAVLQECPFYDLGIGKRGWELFYGAELCLVSKFPFEVLDVPDREAIMRQGGGEPIRFEIDAPTGSFQLLNLHLETIRGGLEVLRSGGWNALSQFASSRGDAMRQSRAARDKTRRGVESLLVAGDFNLPVESAIYREDWGDLTNAFSRCGRGFGHTKSTRLFGIRIDHVLMSNHWTCTNARVMSSPYGGDHAPLIVDLRLR
jgi:hypothetical protein